MSKQSGLFLDAFSTLPDPRKDVNKKHLFSDILFISLCAIISGVRGWEEIEDFAVDREKWLRKYIKLPYGIPSHDVIRHVFLFLDTKAFNECFVVWVESIKPSFQEAHIAIDGKTSRRSGSKISCIKALHTVSAWASKQALVLGQVHVNDKSNEITAIPDLLEMLELKGCLVTIDAMGCQKSIAEKILKKNGEYLLAVKANQKRLFEEIEDFFKDALEIDFKDIFFEHFKDTEKDHGRIEKRSYYLTNDIDDLVEVKKWSGLKSILMVVAERKVEGKTSLEKRFYISSLKNGIERHRKAIRDHWGIENSLHWVLDVCFEEDQCRKRIENSAANISTLRKIAINMIRSEITFKASVNRKMLKAGRSTDYLEKLLQI